MADRVFGPHVSGLNVLGIHIGATIEVLRDDAGGAGVPQSLSLVLSSPLGASSTIAHVGNGQTTSVAASPGITVSAAVDNCRTQPAHGGSPELFLFKVTVRAQGTVKVALFPIPVNVQVDAFDVTVPTDAATHQALRESFAQPPA